MTEPEFLPTQEEDTDIDVKVEITKPRYWNCIIWDDPKTTFQFVIHILTSVFKKSQEEATELTQSIHKTGKGIAGSYFYEIASQKTSEVVELARSNGFPLQASIEEQKD